MPFRSRKEESFCSAAFQCTDSEAHRNPRGYVSQRLAGAESRLPVNGAPTWCGRPPEGRPCGLQRYVEGAEGGGGTTSGTSGGSLAMTGYLRKLGENTTWPDSSEVKRAWCLPPGNRPLCSWVQWKFGMWIIPLLPTRVKCMAWEGLWTDHYQNPRYIQVGGPIGHETCQWNLSIRECFRMYMTYILVPFAVT